MFEVPYSHALLSSVATKELVVIALKVVLRMILRTKIDVGYRSRLFLMHPPPSMRPASLLPNAMLRASPDARLLSIMHIRAIFGDMRRGSKFISTYSGSIQITKAQVHLRFSGCLLQSSSSSRLMILPSSCILPMALLTLSNVSIVVMAAGTARIMFVPMPL